MYLNKCLATIIIILIILIIEYSFYQQNKYFYEQKLNNYLHGYWEADDSFAELSNIDDMILTINNSDMSGMLLIVINNEIDQKNNLSLYIENVIYKDNIYQFQLEFINDGNNDFIWNERKLNAYIDHYRGIFEIYNNKTLIAKLIKNNSMTMALD